MRELQTGTKAALAMGIVMMMAATTLGAESMGAPLPFSADWGYYENGEVLEGGTYHAGADALRIDRIHGPETDSQIYRFLEMTVHVLDHDARNVSSSQFTENPLERMFDVGRFGSPCVADAQTQRVGSETIDGRATEVWECTVRNFEFTVWYCPRLQTPVRLVAEGHEDYFALKNIREGAPADELFAVPSGYTRR